MILASVYFGVLIGAVIVLAIWARRLKRPRFAGSAAQAEGPRAKAHLFWQVPVVVVVMVAGWIWGAWFAVPEVGHFYVSETWEDPQSMAYPAIGLSSITRFAEHRWRDTKPLERARWIHVQLAGDAQAGVPNLRVEDSLAWAARDRHVQLEGDAFDAQALLGWFAEAGIDVDDPRVQAEAEYVARRVVQRLRGESPGGGAEAPFADSNVRAHLHWGNRDGMIFTAVARFLTAPLYIAIGILMGKVLYRPWGGGANAEWIMGNG